MRPLTTWSSTVLKDAHELTVTEATKRGVAGLVADAERGDALVVTRHRRPVADKGRRTSLDEVMAAFGHTRESLADIEDDE
ncbi:hypothetical protein DL990_03830 [Amycolatopsis sp. WAC 01416]|uniref:hypothetical protein n=1 Tax=Amycolatopsis sp. WAC 01416 TaxID=2203196 RepID=UPI000F7AF557|nr:hypothetical protein [Amycolatopsis sp. WAC 01416]RSN38141.1 hypothetical protein DL990_03830 [Amycolatopsis sp. WAC 01416]